MEQTASTINMPKIKDFLKKYNFYIVCFFCLVFSVCAIWVKPLFMIFFLVALGISCLFYDVNKVLVLCSFSIFFGRIVGNFHGIVIFCTAIFVVCLREIILKRIKISKDLILPGIILAIYVVLFYSIELNTERLYAVYNTIFPIMFAIEIYTLRDQIKISKIFKGMSVVLIVGCIAALLSYYIGNYYFVYHIDSKGIYRFMGFLSHENTLSLWSTIFISIAVFLYFKRKINLLTFGVFAFFFTLFGALTKSKAFLLVFALLVLVFLVINYIRNWKIGLVQTIFLLVVFGLCFAIFSSKMTQYFQRFFAYVSEEKGFIDVITTGRVSVWRHYIKVWIESPLTIIFGHGGTYATDLEFGSHNIIIEILVYYGIVGVILDAILIMYFMYKLSKGRKHSFVDYIPLIVTILFAMIEVLKNDRAILIVLTCFIASFGEMKKREMEPNKKNVEVVYGTDLISVIIPIYNVEKYLSKCVESILNQTYHNLEIILVDDGSPDGCPQICDEYAQKDKRVKVIHKTNGGVSSARNAGLEIATGDYIIFIDSDDYIDKNMLAHMKKDAEDNNSDIVVCNFNIEKDSEIKRCNEKIIKNFCETKDLAYIFNRSRFVENDDEFSISHTFSCFLWRMMFSRKSISELKFDEKLRVMEDVEFFVRVLKKDVKISYLNEYLYFYQIRQNSAMRTKKEIIDNHIRLYELLSKTLKNESELLSHFSYSLYVDCAVRNIVYNTKDDLSRIVDWGTKENYKINKKHVFGLDLKFRNFLVYHKMYFILKILYKIGGKA